MSLEIVKDKSVVFKMLISVLRFSEEGDENAGGVKIKHKMTYM